MTALDRYSAMNISAPWRGLNVVPNAAIPQGERQAVMYLYSGILAAASTPGGTAGRNDIIYQAYPPSGHSNRSVVGLGHWFRRLKTCESS